MGAACAAGQRASHASNYTQPPVAKDNYVSKGYGPSIPYNDYWPENDVPGGLPGLGWGTLLPSVGLKTNTNYDFMSQAYRNNRASLPWHAGVDYVAAIDASVQAISEGIVLQLFRHDSTFKTSSTYSPNSLNMSHLYVLHKTALGSQFMAIYGHVRPLDGITVGQRVYKNQPIGLVKKFGSPEHVHFEISSDLQRKQTNPLKPSTAFGFTSFTSPDKVLRPMQHLVENPANLSTIVLHRIKDSSQGFTNASANEGAVAIRNLLDSGIILDNFTFDSSRSGDNIWHRMHSPISRDEFHKMSATAAGIINSTRTFSGLSSPTGYLKLGELLLLCNSRFSLGVSTSGDQATVQKRLVEAFKSTREFSRRKNGRLAAATQILNRWLPASRQDRAPLNGLIDLTPSGQKTYIPEPDYTSTNFFGYNLPVSRALAAEILNKILHFRAAFSSNIDTPLR